MPTLRKHLIVSILAAMVAAICFSSNAEAQQGCCSWHGGVSECKWIIGAYCNGQEHMFDHSHFVMCQDGTISPTCCCE